MRFVTHPYHGRVKHFKHAVLILKIRTTIYQQLNQYNKIHCQNFLLIFIILRLLCYVMTQFTLSRPIPNGEKKCYFNTISREECLEKKVIKFI
jgi:hypothetical protein